MKKTFLIALVTGLFCGCLRAQSIISTPSDSLRVLNLGDSYTSGRLIAPDQTLPALLVKKLNSKQIFTAKAVVVAQEGWRTDELLNGIASAKLQHHFDFVTMLIGVNNQFQHKDKGTYHKEFKQLLDSCVAFASGRAKRVIVLSIPDWGVTPFAANRNPDRIAIEIDAYNEINKELSKKAGVIYIDITSLSRNTANDPETLATDKLHPSAKTYGWWADKVVAAIKSHLK